MESDVTFCVPEEICNSDEDCGGNYVCNQPQNVCGPTIIGQYCNSGDVWEKDSCNNWVRIYDHCDSDQTCQGGTCVNEGTPPCIYCDHPGTQSTCPDGWICEDWSTDVSFIICAPIGESVYECQPD